MANNFTTTFASPGGESTLSVTRTTLRARVARYLGWNSDDDEWDTEMESDIDAIIKSGERNFYQPLVQPGERSVHAWSFLNPILELEVEEDDDDIALPADFSAFVDPTLKWAPANNQLYEVTLTSTSEILRHRQLDDNSPSNMPVLAAVQPLASDQSGGQRFQIMLWPAAEEDGTLIGQYYANPYAISDDSPYPLGGQPHSECLLESCLAAAELHQNDDLGIHRTQFEKLLQSAIALDRKLSVPRLFGQNLDRSGGCYDLMDARVRHRGTITLNGV